MQVVTKATLDQFQNALGVNRRASWTEAQDGQRVYQIDNSLDPTFEIVGKVADAYWKGLPLSVPDYYDQRCKVRLCHYSDATIPTRPVGGYIVLDGELLGFHNVLRGYGDWMMRNAVDDGAVSLSCLDVPQLIALYRKHGFNECRRECNRERGKLDVVWMKRV